METQQRLVVPKRLWKPDEVPWGEEAWSGAAEFSVRNFHEKSSNHRPPVVGKIMHDGDRIAVRFDVDDYYLLAAQVEPMSAVYTDSCVEFFVRPGGEGGYFNFEMNACGVPLVSYVTDWDRSSGQLAGCQPFTRGDLLSIPRRTVLSEIIKPERVGPVKYTICWVVECGLLRQYRKDVPPLGGNRWTANFYKCADGTSHPHWGSWNRVGPALNFHVPEQFGVLEFQA